MCPPGAKSAGFFHALGTTFPNSRERVLTAIHLRNSMNSSTDSEVKQVKPSPVGGEAAFPELT